MPLGNSYRIVADLGCGGMADVFLAVSRGRGGFNKLLVLKLLRRSLVSDPDFLEMFMNEARLAARLNHPHVVQTYEVTEEHGRPIIVMEYLEGQPLSALRMRSERRAKGFPLNLHLRVIADALNGLHYAHELCDYDGTPLEIVHRDATPHNIFVTFDGQVKVLDFGIAKARITASDTRAGVVKGKVHYMSPEQLGGFPIDRRADVFAMGVVLWEALAGQRLWTEPDVAVMTMMLHGDIASPRSINPEVPEVLEQICMKALAMNPADRYETAAAFENAIEQYLATAEESGSSKDLGRCVAEMFSDVRDEVAKLLATEVKKAELLPAQDLHTLQSSAVPSIASIAKTVATLDGAHRSVTGEQIDTDLRIAMHQKRSRRFAMVAIAAVLFSILMFFVLSRQNTAANAIPPPPPPTPTPTEEPAETTTAEVTATPAPVTMVELDIRATPRRAKLYFDDTEIEGNPTKLSKPADEGEHTIRAEASGYQSEEITVHLAKDEEIRIALKPKVAHARPTPPSTPTKPPVTTPTGPDCSMPWYVDANGVKRVRVECL